MLAPDASAFLVGEFQKQGNQAKSVKKFVDAVLSRGAALDGNRISKDMCVEILLGWQSEVTCSDQSLFIIDAMQVGHCLFQQWFDTSANTYYGYTFL